MQTWKSRVAQGSLPYFAEGGEACEQQAAARGLLRMWRLIGMCAFYLNRWHRTWVSRAIPRRKRGTNTKDTQPPFGNPTVPPGDAFDIIAQSPPVTCHRKHQGLGTPEIHLTAHPKKGLVIGLGFCFFGRCQIFVFFLSAWILSNNLGPGEGLK